MANNEGVYYDGKQITLSPGDTRRYYTQAHGGYNVFYIPNAGNEAYCYNRYSVNGHNENEMGYGTYVAPHRLLISAAYRVEYARNLASTVSLVYEGMNMGYAGGFGSTRYSYTMASNIVNDYGSNNLLYVPATREELDRWDFTDNGTVDGAGGQKIAYTADMQRDDFWAYINQDDYLRTRKGDYTERGGAIMPWHNQLDLKFMQDISLTIGGRRNTLQLGVDVKNFLNLLNRNWGLYKSVNNYAILDYGGEGFKFMKNGSERLTETYSYLTSVNSTFSVQFSIRYIFS